MAARDLGLGPSAGRTPTLAGQRDRALLLLELEVLDVERDELRAS